MSRRLHGFRYRALEVPRLAVAGDYGVVEVLCPLLDAFFPAPRSSAASSSIRAKSSLPNQCEQEQVPAPLRFPGA